jgi:hypothetical protein
MMEAFGDICNLFNRLPYLSVTGAGPRMGDHRIQQPQTVQG